MGEQVKQDDEYRVIIGLGATGLSCARHLHARNLPFAVVDSRAQPPGLETLRREMPGVEVFSSDCPPDLIAAAVELVVSPGVALDEPVVAAAVAAGTAVIGDIDLFVREASVPVVGITGSNAKSTVTELVGQMARDAGLNVGIGGNLGMPALALLAPERELYVLELSSFQLERCDELNLSLAAVLNVTADHLDRHGNMSEYRRAKHRIFDGCRTAVVNSDDPLTIPLLQSSIDIVSWRTAEPEAGGFGLRQQDGVEYFSQDEALLMPVAELGLSGRHNLANALAALALGSSIGLSADAMASTLRAFQGLPHRCQPVSVANGVRFVNDSKGTNVGATQAALIGLGGDRDIVLLAGGQGKGADFNVLQPAVQQHCKMVVLFGEDAQALEQALSDSAAVVVVATMEEAVAAAVAKAVPGDCVLLSPACASFDMYSGYGQRGEAFCAAVAQFTGAADE